jgi:hypothetical protein
MELAMARAWYKNLPLVAGFGLILLGAGNWATGTVRLREHAAVATSAPAEEHPSGARTAKDPEVELAQVRMDFYHVVASGGRLMTAAGFILSMFGLARRFGREARKE